MVIAYRHTITRSQADVLPHQCLRCQFDAIAHYAGWEIQYADVVPGLNVSHYVLVEELDHQRYAVSKHQMLAHKLKLETSRFMA